MLKKFRLSGEKNASMIERAAEYILSLKHEKIKSLTAADVAAKVDKNLVFLSLIFKIVRKISLANFILREKLHRAYYILKKDQDISILELSKKLGFPDAEIFEEEFEKYYAIKPILFQEFKERNRDILYEAPKNVFAQLRDIV